MVENDLRLIHQFFDCVNEDKLEYAQALCQSNLILPCFTGYYEIDLTTSFRNEIEVNGKVFSQNNQVNVFKMLFLVERGKITKIQ